MFEYLDKLLTAVNTLIGEMDKHRLINYGAQKVENKNYQHINKLIDSGLRVKREAQQKGVVDDDYKRS